MRNKIISVAEAVDMIPDGATIMYGGFLGCGSAHHIIEALAQKGTKDLTIIGNDCGMATGPNGEEFYGMAKLVHNHQVKHVIDTARRVDDATIFHQNHCASSFKCSYITIAPSRIDSMVANSFLLWLMPFTHGMNTMPVSQMCANDMAS